MNRAEKNRVEKIAFASEENKGLESMLGHHFGRCPFYIFVDIKDGQVKGIEAKENPFLAKHEAGKLPQFISDQGAKVIITAEMGPMALEWFRKFKIKPITIRPRKIKKILPDYLDGKLQDAEPCSDNKR